MVERERRGGCASAVVAKLRLRPNLREAAIPPWVGGGEDVCGLCEVSNEGKHEGKASCKGFG